MQARRRRFPRRCHRTDGKFGEVIDAKACKCGCRFFTEAENAETTVFRIQLDADLVQPLLILAEHFGDTADREDVADSGHGQAA